MARDKGSLEEAPDDFLRECQDLWHKAMALAGDAYAAKSAQLEARLAEAAEETRKLREQVDPLVSTRDSQARSLVELNKQIKELQTTLNTEREQNAGIHERLDESERQLKEALEDIARFETKLREAETETLAEAKKRNAAEARLVSLEQHLQENVSDAVGDVQSNLNKVSSKLEVITAERDRLNQDLADAFETIAMLETRTKKASDQGSASSALQQKIATLESEIGSLKRKNERLNAECDEFAQKNAELLKRMHATAPT